MRIILCTLVTMLCISIFGQFNVTQYLNTHGTEATIIEVVHHLPSPSLMIELLEVHPLSYS